MQVGRDSDDDVLTVTMLAMLAVAIECMDKSDNLHTGR